MKTLLQNDWGDFVGESICKENLNNFLIMLNNYFLLFLSANHAFRAELYLKKNIYNFIFTLRFTRKKNSFQFYRLHFHNF